MKRYDIPMSFDPTTGLIDASNIDGFVPGRALAIVDSTARMMLYDIVTPGLGFASTSGQQMRVEVSTAGCNVDDALLIVWDDGFSAAGQSSTAVPTLTLDMSLPGYSLLGII